MSSFFLSPLGPEGCTEIGSGNTVFEAFLNYVVNILIICTAAAVLAIREPYPIEKRASRVVIGHKSKHHLDKIST